MSIVKMKRLRVIGFSEQRDELLQQLLHLGCVEISEPDDKVTDPEWTALLRRDTSSLASRKAEGAALNSALDALKKYAPAKKGLFQKRYDITEAKFFDEHAKAAALACAQSINDCTREIAQIYSAENKLNANLAGLLPWADLDLPLEQQHTAHAELVLGAVPAAAEESALQADLAAATDLAQLTPISADKDQRYFLLIVHKDAMEDALNALRAHSFGVVRFKDLTGTPQQNIDRMRGEFAALEQQRKEQETAIAAQKDQRAVLQLALDRVNQEISREAVAERFLTDGRIFFAEGWIPAERVVDFSVLLKHFTCAWETADPVEGDAVPTKA